MINATGYADRLVSRVNFDVFRKSSLYSVNLLLPKSVLGHHLVLDYTKCVRPLCLIRRSTQDFLKESSVSVLSDGVSLSLQHPSRLYSLSYSLAWRDMLPAFDVDVERRSLRRVSRAMLRQCRPSLKSTLSASLSLDSRDNPVLPTAGSALRLQLVSTVPRFERRRAAACWET